MKLLVGTVAVLPSIVPEPEEEQPVPSSTFSAFSVIAAVFVGCGLVQIYVGCWIKRRKRQEAAAASAGTAPTDSSAQELKGVEGSSQQIAIAEGDGLQGDEESGIAGDMEVPLEGRGRAVSLSLVSPRIEDEEVFTGDNSEAASNDQRTPGGSSESNEPNGGESPSLTDEADEEDETPIGAATGEATKAAERKDSL